MCRSVIAAVVSAAVLWPGALRSAGSQEKKPETSQDSVPISGTIDTWYRIMQGERHIGFLHETLERVSGPWRYNYGLQLDAEPLQKDPRNPEREHPVTVAGTIQARLDDTFAPVDWRENVNIYGIEILRTITLTETGRRVEVSSGGKRESIDIPSEEDVSFDSFLLMYALRQNQGLAKPGMRKVKIFAPSGEGGPPLTEISFEVGATAQRDYLDKKTCVVTRVAFIKPPRLASKEFETVEVYVDKYGRVVEAAYRNGIKLLIAKDEKEAVGERTLRHGGRRDPFTRPQRAPGSAGSGSGDTEDPKEKGGKVVPVSELQKELAAAKKMLEELRGKEPGRSEEGEKIYQDLLRSYHAMLDAAKKGQPVLVSEIEDLRRNAEEVWGGASRVRDQARVLYVGAAEDMEREDAAGMERKIADLKKYRERIELKHPEEIQPVDNWLSELEPLLQKCKTRIELARKKLELTGTVSQYEDAPQKVDLAVSVFGHDVRASQEVRFIKATHFAIINGKMYKVGDSVEGEGVKIEKILAHGIQVSLREETRDVGLKQ